MIYVDRAIYPKSGQLWCHLFTDKGGDVDELHAFAQFIGLKRDWFQDRAGFPHYDLAPKYRAAAVRNGARQVNEKQMVAIVRGREVEATL